MTDYQCFGVRMSGDTTIVDLKQKNLSEFDFQEQLRDELLEFVTTNLPKQLVVNLANVELIGSNAIGVIIDVRKTVHDNGGSLVLSDVTSTVRMSFQVLNLEGTLFKIVDSESDALNAFD